MSGREGGRGGAGGGGGKEGGGVHWGTTRGKGGGSDSHLYIIEGLISFETNKVTRPSKQRCNKIDLEIRI